MPSVTYLTGGGGGGSPTTFFQEIPIGAIDGSNASFTVSHTPIVGSFNLYKNGQRMVDGGVDYTITGTALTYTIASKPLTGDTHAATYSY